MKKIDLCGKWKLIRQNGDTYNAAIPGCVHTDLFEIEDIFCEDNSKKCQFIENENWTYETEFVLDELSTNAVLVFEGLDTYCNIYINGSKVGFADNMFIPHSFNISNFIRIGKNSLCVEFLSPIKYVQNKEALPGAFTTERLHTRRMQCSYGWDWLERFVTMGIFKPCYIEFQTEMKTDCVYVITKNIDKYSASIKISEYFSHYKNGENVITEIYDPFQNLIYTSDFYCKERLLVLNIDIPSPQLWYPNGYGEQPLYTLKISINDEVFYQKFGIRTVKILQIYDEENSCAYKKCKLLQTTNGKSFDHNNQYSCFTPVINNKKVFCIGANWVPCEPFPSAETSSKISEILELAANAGINMIRVWGGGIFEQQHFYDECDRLGLMVTQDFMMACGNYPENDEAFLNQLSKEAEYAAVALRNHPSLVWWTGDNENAVDGSDSMCDYPGRIASHKAILPVLERLDHNREFLYSSPFGGNRYGSKTVGTTHNTLFLGDMFSYINKKSLSDYRREWKNYIARFIAEEPIFGAVMPNSLKKFIKEDPSDYKMWLWHTKTNPGLGSELLDISTDFAEKLFGKFQDWDDKYFKMRYLQYEWVQLTLQNARINWDFCSGIVYWMLNDCWPAASGWSVIDYYNNVKAGYYAIKNLSKVIVGAFDYESNLTFCISNIDTSPKQCCLKIKKINYITNASEIILENDLTATPGTTELPLNTRPADDELFISYLECDDEYNVAYYKNGTPSIEKCSCFTYRINENKIEISSDVFLFAVEILGADYLSCNYFMLESGKPFTVKFSGKPENITVNAYRLIQ